MPASEKEQAGVERPPTKPQSIKAHTTPVVDTVKTQNGHKEAVASATAGKSSAAATSRPVSSNAKITTDAVCDTHAKTDDILVVMKTGATEAYDKLPIHFMTTLRCANDTILFSDMEMEMGGHHIIDALEDIKPEVMADNHDFELYKTLKQYHDLFEDPRGLKNGGNGWNLDKYKFNHVMLKTWKYRQDPAWYVFIEADTYVFWDNLRTLLDKYNPDQPYYFGSPTYLDIEFAHGGTGYIFSREAMKRGVGQHPDLADKYDKVVKDYCCGDRFPAKIMLDEDIKLTKAWPMFNGEKPHTLPYGKNHWCQPLITMHHMTAQEVSQVWTYEQIRKQQDTKNPIMIKDMYERFVKDNLEKPDAAYKEDWDNLSSDMLYKPDIKTDPNPGVNDGGDYQALPELKRKAAENPQYCQQLCDSESSCFGWKHKDNECRLSKSLKFGGHMDPDGGKRFTSGWNMKVIKQFIADMGDCPSGPDWTVRGI